MYLLTRLSCAILCSATALGAAVAVDGTADETGATPTMLLTLDSPIAVDHRVLGESLHDADLAAAKELGVFLGHAPRQNWLGDALDSLAEEDERYAFRTRRWASGSWLEDGGVGTYRVGNPERPETRVEEFASRIAQRDLADQVDVAALTFAADDITHGRKVEVAHEVYRVRFDVRSSSVSLEGVFTENITAQRIAGRGPGSGGVVFTDNFPIELPNIEMRGVNTSAVAPGGTGGGGGRPQAISELSTRPVLHPRDSRIAFSNTIDTYDALAMAYHEPVWVWTTVPLRNGENLQRNAYNHFVRAFLQANAQLKNADSEVEGDPLPGEHRLFDVAAILSHDPDGTLVMDRQGPVIAPDYLEDDGETINALGQRRIAEAWWHLMARIAQERG